jgi:hypothetical protein
LEAVREEIDRGVSFWHSATLDTNAYIFNGLFPAVKFLLLGGEFHLGGAALRTKVTKEVTQWLW